MTTPELSGYLLGKSLGILAACLVSPDLEAHGESQAQEANLLCEALGLAHSFIFPSDVAHRSEYHHKTFGHGAGAYFYRVVEALEQTYGKRARASFEIGFLLPQWKAGTGFPKKWQEGLSRSFRFLKLHEATQEMILHGDRQDEFLEGLGRLQGFLGKPRTVFLSYRRDGGAPFARMIYIHLSYSGYDVFLDVETLGAVEFGAEIFSAIDRSFYFMPVLTPLALEACASEEDWLHKELSHGLAKCSKIIPIVCEGFSWPDDSTVHDLVRHLARYNACQLSHTNFKGFADRLEYMLE